MASKTGTAFLCALFPPVFLFQRLLSADVGFLLTDRRLDDKNHVNRCVIRAFANYPRNIDIPVCCKGRIDDINVPDRDNWLPKMQEELKRAYCGLPMASAARELLAESMTLPFGSPWLMDYLTHAFVTTLKYLGWKKEILLGVTPQRHRYVVDSEYLRDLCLENGCNRFIVGRGAEIKYRKLFHAAGVTVEIQDWQGTATLSGRDSILDAIARFSAADILEQLSR